MIFPAKVRIGTRGSALALVQTEIVRRKLAAAHGLASDAFEIVPIRTSGDAVLDRPLADAGGKGLFTKELDQALIDGRIDLAVHSAKDVPTFLPPGVRLAAYPVRDDPRDAFVGRGKIAELRRGAVVGTSSVRREALLRRMRPDLQLKLLRGNVETRIRKIDAGEYDGGVLAFAGLQRLGLAVKATDTLDPAVFPPSPGQGAIAIEVRERDEAMGAMVAAIDDPIVSVALATERAFLAALDGSCRTPIAAHATVADGRIRFRGMLIAPDGKEAVEAIREGAVAEGERMGRDAGRELRARAPAGVLSL